MEKISPVCPNTLVGRDPHEWNPKDFDDFLRELESIISSCPGNSPLFRGHACDEWLLDSTFVRNCKKILFDLEPHIRLNEEIQKSVEYHQVLFSLLLLKFDLLARPSDELQDLENQEGIDALFEFIKRCQQYPDEDKCNLKGTFFLDWSQKKNVGLFFANYDANDNESKNRNGEGALFVCDQTATGKTFMRRNGEPRRVHEIIGLMLKANNQNKSFGCPLLFYPPKQIRNLRANRQDAIYWAQMDLRYNLEEIWRRQEKDNEYIFIKLVLPDGTQRECEDYLKKQSPPITHRYLFPLEES